MKYWLIAATGLLLTEHVLLAAEPPDAPIVVDTVRQLFLDDYLVASTDNIVRKMHAARKHPANPVLRPTEPWEGNNVLLFGSVLREECQKFRMWYLGGGGLAYAESRDGLHWDKPTFDLVESEGHSTNVLVRLRASVEADVAALAEHEAGVPNAIPFFQEPHGVHRDPADPDPSRRYKMTFHAKDYREKQKRRGMGVAASPDGIHWRLLSNWVTTATNDISHLMWDPARNRWVLYGRTKHHSDEVLQAWGDDDHFKKYNYGRAVTRLESPDLLTWDHTTWQQSPIVMAADTADPVGTEIYSMQVFPYESVYLGLVQVFHNSPEGTVLEIQLAVSRDGVHFERIGERAPFIPCGGIGQWDRFNNAIADTAPIAMGDELWFYYSGRSYRHGPYGGTDSAKSSDAQLRGAIGIATVPRDRFVSLGASFDGGQVTTRPVTLKGTNLHLNAKADFGSIVVEVLDAAGAILARSRPVRKDGFDLAVVWEKGTLDEIREPVTLRITLENALLFALWCE